ncbi:MAG: arsenical pump rane protein [Solirubrobacteraceae bacterium]|nr:arsenical pump rane protein [Solirubrobacteraceae bacterium]
MALREAALQAWPPFVLVTGLLLIGLVAHAEGLFERAGRRLERLPGPPGALLAGGIGLVAVVTAVLNLDTAVVFLTPVLVLAARARGVDERPFLYAAVYLANASSLYLPGSNLTNLLVLAREPQPGGEFAARLLAPALAATVVTAVGVRFLFRRELGADPDPPPRAAPAPGPGPGPERGRGGGALGVAATAAAAGLTLGLAEPALPVLGVGVVAAAVGVGRGRLELRAVIRALGPVVLVLLFLASVGLGTVARIWHGPAALLAGAGSLETAGVGGLAAVALNNLPATVLLSAGAPPHPRALLIGLNLGPNLAVSGSLSAYLWMRAARQVGARPSVATFSRRGVILAPAAIAAALLAASLAGTSV